EPELRGDDNLIPNRRERLADDFFVRERSVRFRRVEEGDAAVNRRADDGDAVVTTGRRPVAEADAHTAESEGRHLEIAAPEPSFLHVVSRLLAEDDSDRLSGWTAFPSVICFAQKRTASAT